MAMKKQKIKIEEAALKHIMKLNTKDVIMIALGFILTFPIRIVGELYIKIHFYIYSHYILIYTSWIKTKIDKIIREGTEK